MKTHTSRAGNVAVEVVVGIVAVVGVVLGIAAIKATGPVSALSQKVDEMSTRIDALGSLAGRADQVEQDVKMVRNSIAALGPEIAGIKEQLAKKPEVTPLKGKEGAVAGEGKKGKDGAVVGEGAGAAPVGPGTIHTIKERDTLGRLAKQYKTTSAAIEKLNPNLNPSKLKIGMKVRVK